MDTKICQVCNKEFTRKKRFNLKWWKAAKYCSQNCYHNASIGRVGYWKGKISHFRGKKHTQEAIKKNRLAHIGKIAWNKDMKGVYSNLRTQEGTVSFRRKMVGSSNPNWRGGSSRIYKTGYNSMEYRDWRKAVFERDGFACRVCGFLGYITAHHIKSFAHYPELRFELNNGITLCGPCHSLTDNYKGRNKAKTKILSWQL